MQIVIDIPEEYYKIRESIENGSIESKMILNSLKNGIPLPKGHGRLIDGNLLKKNICKWLRPSKPDENEMVEVADIAVSTIAEIEEQTTIVEADKEGKNGD